MVEWKKLGEVCSDIIVPMRDRPKVFDGNIPWCRIEDIEGMYFNKSMSGLMVSDKVIKAMNLKVFPTGTVICSCSATLGVCAINTQPLITNQTFIGLVCSECLNNHFLYYYMLTRKKELKSLSTTGTIPYVSREKFEKMVIPVPSLTEQTRIVGILDTFTASIENLKQQIAQRHKQYEHYRDQLLDLEGKEGVEMKMSDFCLLKAGKSVSANEITDCENGRYACYGGNGIRGYISYYSHEGDYPIIGRQGALCGCVCWATDKFYATEHAVVVTGKEFMSQRFLFHLFQNANLNQYKTQGAQPGLSVMKLNEVCFLIPSLPEQQRIVSILDTFEASIANLEQQLAQRERQYEYYRNKLLTF